MGPRVAILGALLFAAGCEASACATALECASGSYCAMGQCVSDCASEADCVEQLGEGARCSSLGRCSRPPDDSGVAIDAGGLDAGPPLERDAGSGCAIDDDDDGACGGDGGEDCDDANASANPSATETCDGVDNDCDGEIDPGCTLHLGRPSPLVRLHANPGASEAPRLTQDGLRIYYSSPNATGVRVPWVAARADVEGRFEDPTELEGFGAIAINNFAISSDELEMFVGAALDGVNLDVHRATRASREDAFSPLEPVTELNSASIESHPFLSSSGLELYFTSDRGAATGRRGIFRARRPEIGAPFQPPEALTTPGENTDLSPFVAVDGTLYFARELAAGDRRIFRATPTSAGATTFNPPLEVTDLGTTPASVNSFPFLSFETREIFFTSNRPWSPVPGAIWRARLCFGAPCVEEEIACEGGQRSPDGRHCYQLTTRPGNWSFARGTCGAVSPDTTLATVHSAAEHDLIWSMTGGVSAWLGLTDYDSECNTAVPACRMSWQTGEPFLYANWAALEPNQSMGTDEDCGRMDGLTAGTWNDSPCGMELFYVCETELWPW